MVTKVLHSVNLRPLRDGFAEISGSLLRRCRVDEEASSPLESCNFGQYRYDLQVPVEVVDGPDPKGGAVEYQIVGRHAQRTVHPAEGVRQDVGQGQEIVQGRVLVGRPVLGWENPRLERESGSEGCKGDESLPLQHDPTSALPLLADDVAPDAPALHAEVLEPPRQLLANHDGDNGRGDQLRMRM